MISPRNLVTNVVCLMNQLTNRTLRLPLLIFYPTSRCDSRCMSCDWWKRTSETDLTFDEIEVLSHSVAGQGIRGVLFSGGEPLLRRDIAGIARLFRQPGTELWLVTNGALLAQYAEEVSQHFSRVIVSLDASSAALHQQVRGVQAWSAVVTGVQRLREEAPHLPMTARATLHKANYRDMPAIADRAKAMGFDGVSFLAADVSSTAFGREAPLNAERANALLLSRADVAEFEVTIAQASVSHRDAFESGFIAESPEKLGRLSRYYAGMRGDGALPPVRCNAPWVSVVVEADGTVRPCYFHEPVGNVRDKPLTEIIENELRAFREGLDVTYDPLCQRCTCSLRVSLLCEIW